MARPSPEILDTILIDETYVDILSVTGVYMLTYQNKPVSIRKRTQLIDGEVYKYNRTQWPNKKIAENQAAKFNAQFMTTDFGIKKVT